MNIGILALGRGTFDIEFANQKSCELALKAKEKSKKEIFIAGSIPAQFDSYKEDKRAKEIIYQNFK